MIYIVISNRDYYPEAGARDWKCVTPDLSVAEQAYNDASGDDVFLVLVDAVRGDRVLAERHG